MKLLELIPPIDTALNRKLHEFEALFDYPLGDSQRFRIDHSPDYTAFYRAMGQARTWVVEFNDMVIAAISTVTRTISIQGTARKIVYIGDLKIHPRHQSGRILFNIAKCLRPLLEKSVTAAYSVVMDGTSVTPEHYTGRLGIPVFKPVAKLHIMRFETANHEKGSVQGVASDEGYALYKQLSNTAYHSLTATEIRSIIPPQWFLSTQQACGMVEDTRKAKRLYISNDDELLSAHLSYFSFEDAGAGYSVITSALEYAFQKQYPAMFVALSQEQYSLLSSLLSNLRYTESFATLYATDNICAHIPINTAEI